MSSGYRLCFTILLPAIIFSTRCANNSADVSNQDTEKQTTSSEQILSQEQNQSVAVIVVDNKVSAPTEKKGGSLDPKYVRNHWQEYIRVSAARPDELAAPGIFNKQVTATNTLPYELDSLVVLVTYFDGGDCLAGIYTRMHNIASGATISENIPDNSHARTFQYQVRKVICRGVDLCFDIDEQHEGDDPFLCKKK